MQMGRKKMYIESLGGNQVLVFKSIGQVCQPLYDVTYVMANSQMADQLSLNKFFFYDATYFIKHLLKCKQ
jgi:hypothetical protein